MADTTTTFTNGYAGSYKISIPKYLATNTGVAIVAYVGEYDGATHPIFTGQSLQSGYYYPCLYINDSTGGVIKENYCSYFQDDSGSNDLMNSSMNYNSWNTFVIFNKNGTLELSVNGTTISRGNLVAESVVDIQCTTNTIIASMAYITSDSITYPFDTNSNVTSYIDFSNPSSPLIKGDTTLLTVESQTLTASTPISNVPAIEITSTNFPSYTNGYTGTYDITIPNYLTSGTGISIVFYTTNTSSIQVVFNSVDYSGTSGSMALAINNADNGSALPYNTQYIQMSGSTYYDLDVTSSLVVGWNTVTIFNNSGILTMTVNGKSGTKNYITHTFKEIAIKPTANTIIAGFAYTNSSTVPNYPFNEASNVLSYIDFADPNNPKIYGDTSQFSITSTSLTSSTPLINVPSIEITHTDSGNGGDNSNTNTFGEVTLEDSSTLGNKAVLMGGGHVTTINDDFVHVEKLSPTGLNARQINDKFGSVLAQGDGFIAAGVPNHSYSVDGTTSIVNTGAVYIFREQSDGSWAQEKKLGLSTNNLGTKFGSSLYALGSDLFIGSPYYDYDSDGANESDDAGAVFHYSYDSSTGWALKSTIIASGVNGRNANDWFGWAIDGDTTNLFIGAPGHQYDTSGANALVQAGAVFHYKLVDGVWTFSEKIVGLGANPRSSADLFGSNIKFNGSRLLVQAPGYKFDQQGSSSVTGAGAVFVMNYTSGSPVYEGRLISSNRDENLNFGKIIDIDQYLVTVSGMTGRLQEEFQYDGTSWSSITATSYSDLIPDKQIDLSASGVSSLNSRVGTNLANTAIGTGDFTAEFWIYYMGMVNQSDWDLLQSNNAYVNGNPGGASTNGKNGFTILINGYSNTDTLGKIHFVCLETRYMINLIPNYAALTHIAVVRKNGILSFYQNGVLIQSVANSSNFSDTTGYKMGTAIYNGGFLTAVRLTPSALYSSNFSLPAKNLPADNTTLYRMANTNLGSMTSRSISPYSDNTAESASFDNSYSSIDTYFTTSIKNSAIFSFWFMLDNSKQVNGAFYNALGTHLQNTVVPNSPLFTFMNNLILTNIDNSTFATTDIGYYCNLGFDNNVIDGTPSNIIEGQWYHITLSYSGNRAELYLNGNYVMSATYDGDINDARLFTISDFSGSNLQYVSDVRVYFDKILNLSNIEVPSTAIKDPGIVAQADSAFYMNNKVALSDTTMSSSNILNTKTYDVDNQLYGAIQVGQQIIAPSGKTSAIKAGSFGNKVKIKGNKVLIQSPADSTNIRDNASVPMAGAVYEFDVSSSVSTANKIVSNYRGINTLYFGDDFAINSDGSYEIYSPRQTIQNSIISGRYSEYVIFSGTQYLGSLNVRQSLGNTQTKTGVAPILLNMTTASTGVIWNTLAGVLSYNAAITPSTALTKLVNMDTVSGISYNFSTAASAYTGYKPTIASGALTSFATTSTASTTLTSPGTTNRRNANQNYGFSVDQTDGMIIIGAPGSAYDQYGSTAYGAVYVVDSTTNNQLYTVSTTDSSLTSFGYRVTATGTKLLIGNTKQGYEEALLYSITNTGATSEMGFGVYTSHAETPTWISVWKPAVNVGVGVANTILDDNTIVFGLYGASSPSSNSGAASVATKSDSGWTSAAMVPSGFINARNANDYFGTTVSLDSNLAAIGAPGHAYNADGTAAPAGTSGAVFVYKFDTTSDKWNQNNIITAPTSSGITNFGSTLSVKNNTMVAGNNTNNQYSFVAMTTTDGNTWSPKTVTVGSNADNTGHYTGSATLMSGSHIVIGTPNGSWTTNANVGGFYDSQLVNGSWTTPDFSTSWNEKDCYSHGIYRIPLHTNGRLEKNKIDYTKLMINGRLANDNFGTSVAISPNGNMIAVGVPNMHVSRSGWQGSSYGGIATFYLDNGKFRLQDRTSESDYSSPTTTGIGSSMKFYNDTTLVSGGTAFQSSGILRYISISGSTLTDGVTEYFDNYYKGIGNSTGMGISLDIHQNNIFFGMPTYPNYGSWGTGVTTTGTSWDMSATTPSTVHTIGGVINVRNANDKFGYSVKVVGNRFWAGCPYSYTDLSGNTIATNTGSVYVYDYDTTAKEKTFVEKLLPTTVGSSYFGISIDATTGAFVIGGGTSGSTNPTAQVYDYTTGKTSTLVASLSKTITSTSWGSVVALQSDKNIVIGAADVNIVDSIVFDASYNVASRTSKNASYISDYNSREFNFKTVSASNMLFGNAIATSGNLIAVGVPNWSQNYNGTYYNSGAVLVFNRTTNGFDIEGVLTDNFIGSDSSSLALGNSISIDGDTIVIGTPQRISNAGGYLIYGRTSDGLWDLVNSDRFESSNNKMGSSVAVQGNNLVIGAPFMDGLYYQTPITDTGISYVMSKTNDKWTAFNSKAGGVGTWYPSDAASSINSDASYNSQYLTYAGGGGSGYTGGAVGTIYYGTNPGGNAGTNLVPAGGTESVGTNTSAPMSTDADIGTAGTPGSVTSNGAGLSGGNARIVISDGSSNTIFDYTGGDQSYTVPSSVTTISVKLWGAGGGGGYNRSTVTTVGLGGSGGFVSGDITVTPGETLTIIVGQGGIGGQSYANNSAIPSSFYGDGGLGGSAGLTYFGGSGGGRAEIARSGTSLAIAGGGGGGASIIDNFDTTNIFSNGQSGGTVGSGRNIQPTLLAVTGNVNTRSSYDYFGSAIAQTSGTEIVVGVPGHDFDNNGQSIPSSSGALMVYTYNGSRWVYDYRINASTTYANQYFGSSIATNGTLLVGLGGMIIPYYNGLNHVFVPSSSYIESFTKASSWKSNGVYASETANVFDDVAVVSDTKIIAGNDIMSSTANAPIVYESGGIVTLDLDNNVWGSDVSTVAPGRSFGRQAGDLFGTAVVASSNWIAASAPGHSYSSDAMITINGRGAAFVFHKDINSGQFVYEDKLFNTATDTDFNGSGKFMMFSKNVLSLVSSNSDGTFLSNWTRTNNLFGNMTSGSSDIISISSIAAMDQDKYITGRTAGDDFNQITTGYWNYFPSRSTTLTNQYPNRIVVPGTQNGRNAGDLFGTGVQYIESANVIAVTAPGQAYTATGASISKPGAVYTYYVPVGSSANEYEYESKIYNTGSQATSMKMLDSKNNSLLVSGGTSSALYLRTKIGSWSLQNTITESNALSYALASPTLICEGLSTSYSDASNVAITNSGSVKSYSQSNGTWSLLPTLYVEGMVHSRAANDLFGSSIVMNSNYVMVSSPGHTTTFGGEAMAGSGAIWIYSRVAGKLELVTMVTSPNEAVKSYGNSLSLASDNSYYAVGSPTENKVYVFQFDGLNSTLVTTIVPESDVGTITASTQFGATVAIQNQDLLIGIPGMTDGTAITGGIARYENQNGVWTYIGMMSEFTNSQIYDDQHPQLFTSTDIATPEGDILGSAVAVNKNRGSMFSATGNTTDQTGSNPVSGAGATWFKYLG